jgi:hypothetical protein
MAPWNDDPDMHGENSVDSEGNPIRRLGQTTWYELDDEEDSEEEVFHLICGCVRSGVVYSCSGLSLSTRFARSFSFCSVCSCAHHRGRSEILGV